MKGSGQLNALTTWLPGKNSWIPIEQEAEWAPQQVWALWKRQKCLVLVRKRTMIPWLSSLQPSHWTECALLAPMQFTRENLIYGTDSNVMPMVLKVDTLMKTIVFQEQWHYDIQHDSHHRRYNMPNKRDNSWQTHIFLFPKLSIPILGFPPTF